AEAEEGDLCEVQEEAPAPHATNTAPDLGGDPGDALLLDEPAVRIQQETGAEAPLDESSEEHDLKSELFETSHKNLSGDDDENSG
ncbi:MAG: hypothetical protein O7G30_14915, partial [Proteobacteria bacterium]|nr:hypothetical protein [Pseudomonadota bacterium]